MIRFNSVVLALLICSLGLCLPLSAQAQDSEPASAVKKGDTLSQSTTDQEIADAAASHRRIVDIDQFPRRSPLPARVILWPFRAAAPHVNEFLTWYEKKNFNPGTKAAEEKGLRVQPLFGGLGDGTGLGLGALVSRGDLFKNNVNLFAIGQFTTYRYVETLAGLQVDPTGGQLRRFNLELSGRYRLRPEEDFSGLGPLSLKGQRTSYYLQERGGALTLTTRVAGGLRVGGFVDYSSNRVFAGRDDKLAEIQEVFTALPGLEQGAALLGTGAFIEYEGRDNIAYARSGAFARFTVTNNDSMGRGDFGFIQYLVDARGYIPLGSKRRVLALRLFGNFNEEKGGSQIPFFRLARLGDQTLLRGYTTNRFHDRHALAGTLEYRYQIGRYLDAFLFTDMGQVFARRSQLSFDNLRATYGGGIQFRSEKRVFLKIYVGRSGEFTRLFVNFGPTF